ncbi:GntR family transcriptional regulator [Diaminobutyricibacter tongyongensis]|uniref:GntR family transcriptional regulator n=1 Tax=Leifsonia tongyongensis TaxID=1268043 RepID=A0A6L9XUB8_9MICO|nr:GntR family transcriptional regulator [Diaminobutyricibacter tongyongensis]
MAKASAVPEQRRQLIRDRAYQSIQGAILDGTFQPGEALDDARLQEWLHISRTPIRQALYALSLEGLIDMAPQAHTRVVLPRREDAMAYLQATGVLVGGVTELAAGVASPAQRGQLIDVLNDVVGATRMRDTAAFVSGQRSYFRTINNINPNAILARLSGQAMVALGYYLSVVAHASDIDWGEVGAQYELLIAGWRAADTEAVVIVTRGIFGLRGARLVSTLNAEPA